MSRGQGPMLPVELLTIISSLVRKADLAALASVSKCLNQIATPYLYSELDHFTLKSAMACLLTLGRSPATLAFPGRDLAEYIQVYRLRLTCFKVNFAMCELLGHLLSMIVPRMVNLRNLDISPGGLESASPVLATLVTYPHPRLESMRLCLCPSSQPPTTQGAVSTPTPLLRFPRLQTIQVSAISQLSSRETKQLSMLLEALADQLRHLTLAIESTADLGAIFPRNTTFPVLEHLGLAYRNLDHPVCTALTNIRSLSVRTYSHTNEAPPSVSWTAYPALEELACLYSQVPLFLSPETNPPRPIHTVALDYATYERNGGETTEFVPRWKHIFFAVEHIQYSAVPLRDIRFYVSRLLIPELQHALSLFSSLESLTILVWHEPKRDALFALGEWVFAQLPRLHTFLLGDVMKKQSDHHDHFWFARDVYMQRSLLAEYEKHTSALRRVAFTTEFEWEKGDDGRWYTTDPVDPEVQEEPEDSGDETESTESSFDSDDDDDDDDSDQG